MTLKTRITAALAAAALFAAPVLALATPARASAVETYPNDCSDAFGACTIAPWVNSSARYVIVADESPANSLMSAAIQHDVAVLDAYWSYYPTYLPYPVYEGQNNTALAGSYTKWDNITTGVETVGEGSPSALGCGSTAVACTKTFSGTGYGTCAYGATCIQEATTVAEESGNVGRDEGQLMHEIGLAMGLSEDVPPNNGSPCPGGNCSSTYNYTDSGSPMVLYWARYGSTAYTSFDIYEYVVSYGY